MAVLLRCDAPACDAEVSVALSADGRVVEHGRWWVVRGAARVVVACCDLHLMSAVAVAVKPRGEAGSV